MLDAKCASCGVTLNLQPHHLKYKPDITVTLCRKCHSIVHDRTVGKAPTKGSGVDLPDQPPEPNDTIFQVVSVQTVILRPGQTMEDFISDLKMDSGIIDHIPAKLIIVKDDKSVIDKNLKGWYYDKRRRHPMRLWTEPLEQTDCQIFP